MRRFAFDASFTRSSSPNITFSYSATISIGFSLFDSSQNLSIVLAIKYIRSISFLINFSMFGLSTFIITSFPSSFAECTCATEAEAKHSMSKLSKIFSILSPSEDSIIFLASSPENGLTLSCSLTSSSAISVGNKSFLVEIV